MKVSRNGTIVELSREAKRTSLSLSILFSLIFWSIEFAAVGDTIATANVTPHTSGRFANFVIAPIFLSFFSKPNSIIISEIIIAMSIMRSKGKTKLIVLTSEFKSKSPTVYYIKPLLL